MKIALLTMGTRGDVQPFAVLGKALMEQGHSVTLSTAKNFKSFIDSYNLPFVPVEADFQEILNSPEGKKMMSNPLSARKYLHRLIFPMIRDSLDTFYSVARENDCVLFHVKVMADCFADGTNAKFIRTNVVPAIEPTREFINPVFSFAGLPSIFNRMSYRLSDLGLKMMGKPVAEFRAKNKLPVKFRKSALPSIYGISPHFLPQPKDYSGNSHFTGFWIENSFSELGADLLDFISNGEAPFLFTLGSMPFETKLNLIETLNSLPGLLNIRLIVIKGWGLNDTTVLEQNPDIRVLDSAPYDKLFPHVKAVIHHGGIGTIAACLKAGKPFLTCPVLYPLGDQQFWGNIAVKRGLGLKPVPLKKLTKEALINAIKFLRADPGIHRNAQLVKQKLEAENGIANAISLIAKYS